MQSAQNNRERVYSELERLDGRLRPFIVRQMRDMYGASWQQEALKSLHHPQWTRRGNLHLDTPALLYILRDQWERIFHQRLSPGEREILKELLRARRNVSHQWAVTDNETERVPKNIEYVLSWIGPTDSFSRPTFTQTSTTDLHPRPAETTGKPLVSRRAILIIAAGVVVLGAPILCTLSQQGRDAVQPDQTAMTQKPTTTPLSQSLFTYTKHAMAVNAVAWSPNGKRIASGSDDNTVQVWNASDGTHVFAYHGHSKGVTSVAWSPDGKRIASGSDDTTVQVWNASDGTHVFTYTGHSNEVDVVAWSPDGKRIASGSEYLIDDGSENLRVWNASDGSPVFANSGEAFAVAWSPDGKRIASASVDGVQVWNASDGSHIFTYRGHSDTVDAVIWLPDGQHIASGSVDDTVQVWNASDGTFVFKYTGHSSVVDAVAWSLDGKRIASGSWDDTVQVWNASDGSDVLTYTGHNDTVYAVTWSPDGQRIASGSRDTTVQVWQTV